jgi:hypothetical protein
MGTSNEAESRDENVNSKQQRWFFVGMAIFLILFVILGFGSTYGRQLVLGLEISGSGIAETDWVIHTHAAIFVGWMVLLLTQTSLIANRKTQRHMAIGKTVGIGIAIAVFFAGSLIVHSRNVTAVSEGLVTRAEWPVMIIANMAPLMGLITFSVLFGLGIYNRSKPEVHKRYMIFATITLLIAATSRMEYLLGPWSNTLGTGIMLAPMILYDYYTEQRIRPATLIGSGIVVLSLLVPKLVRYLAG